MLLICLKKKKEAIIILLCFTFNQTAHRFEQFTGIVYNLLYYLIPDGVQVDGTPVLPKCEETHLDSPGKPPVTS